MGYSITLDGTNVEPNAITFDGSDVEVIDLDGTTVWELAPSAEDIVDSLYTNWLQHMRGDYSGCGVPTNNRSYASGSAASCAPYKSGNHTSSYSYSFSLTSPLNKSANQTFIALQVGHNNGPDITTLTVNGSSVSEYDSHNADVNSPIGSLSSDLAISVGHTSTAINSITATSGYFIGSDPSGYLMVGDYSFVIPGKWDIKTKDTGSFSDTILPGEFVIYNNSLSGEVSTLPSSFITTGCNNVVERSGRWYNTTLWGMWVNNTGSNQTFVHSSNSVGATTTVFKYIGA
jgi:hypothetical protein